MRLEEDSNNGAFLSYDAAVNVLALGVREGGTDFGVLNITRFVVANLDGSRREVRPQQTNTFRLGSDEKRWLQVWGSRGLFTGNVQTPLNQDDLVSRHAQNAVVARANIDGVGAVSILGDHWNVASVVRTTGNPVGFYDLTLDEDVNIDSTTLANSFVTSTFATAFFVNTLLLRVVVRDTSAAATDSNFSIVIIGRPNTLP